MLNGGTLAFSQATYSVNENAGTITITVTRTGGTEPATVDYNTTDGSATSAGDYVLTSGTLSFAANQTTATFNVPISDDNLVEGNETFNLALSNVLRTFFGSDRKTLAAVRTASFKNPRISMPS